MKKCYIQALGLLITMSNLYAPEPIIDTLRDIEMGQPDLVVIVDDHVRSLCDLLVDIWRQGAYEPGPWVVKFADQHMDEIPYDLMLEALNSCIEKLQKTIEEKQREILNELKGLYNDLQEEYEELRSQLTRRRLKCKAFCTVITKQLAVNTKANIANACISCLNAGKTTTASLKVDNLEGVVKATSGQLSADLIQTEDIQDDAVTNAKHADNSVTSDNLASMSVLPSKLAFNAIDVFGTEQSPLRLYRGSVAANGTIVSGAGFSVNKTGTGQYSITLSNGYNGTTSYQILATPSTGVDRNINSSQTSGSVFIFETRTNANALVDQQFHFFTLGPLT